MFKYDILHKDIIESEMVKVSNDPKIDNVWDYYLTKEQVSFLDCFWTVLVNKNQEVKRD